MQLGPPLKITQIACDGKPPSSLELKIDRFTVRLAANHEEVRAAQQLRFNVFNLELGEGLALSSQTGLDEDEFDPQFDHLLLFENAGGRIVGTYRLQTAEMAASGKGGYGFYSATEFDLSYLPEKVVVESVELGRACIAEEFRSSEALLLLWRGIVAYTRLSGKRYLFGCCSVKSQSVDEAWELTRMLANEGHLHDDLFVPPLPGFECDSDPDQSESKVFPTPASLQIPRLLQSYLRLGAKVCGPPAIDRRFGTIDFFTLFDLSDLKGRAKKLLLEQ